jgi:hypothetical protein
MANYFVASLHELPHRTISTAQEYRSFAPRISSIFVSPDKNYVYAVQ